MGVNILGGVSGALADVGSGSKGLFAELVDAAGNKLAKADRAALTLASQQGLHVVGADYKLSRLGRVSSDGTQRTSDDSLQFLDSIEGAAVNTLLWTQSTSTMTIAQAAASGITFNAGSSLTSGAFAIHTSQRQFPRVPRSPLLWRGRRRIAHVNNAVAEFGFGAPSGVTVIINNGAFFRRKTDGTLVGVVATNGTEIESAVMTAPAVTDHAMFEIFWEDERATFIVTSAAGALVSQAVVEVTATTAVLMAASHIPAFDRLYNNTAPASAPQLLATETAVYALDALSQKPWRDIMAAIGKSAVMSPTAYTQLANYANSAAPVSAALSNTAAGYTTLGGQWQFAAVAGAETDYALFAFTVPSPYALFVTGVKIDAFNTVVAVATTATLLQWAIANSAADTLASNTNRVLIGAQHFLVADPAGATARPGPVVWNPGTPFMVEPGRRFHVILKMPVGTATATEIIRGTIAVDGYFE